MSASCATLRLCGSAYPHLPIHLRTPLIPGINDDEELIRRIVELARSMDAVHYELLPYHRMGEQKYRFWAGNIPMAALLRWTPGYWRACGYRRGSFPGKGLISVKECISIAEYPPVLSALEDIFIFEYRYVLIFLS